MISKGIFRVSDQDNEDMLIDYFRNGDAPYVFSDDDIPTLMGVIKHINWR